MVGSYESASTQTVAEEEIPRPEYPEPQFQRAEWINLNGTWEFCFDDADVGMKAGWAFHHHQSFPLKILVPFCFESPQSGIVDKGFHYVVWYRRYFLLPPEWKGRRLLLHFGAVDYRAQVWVNGQFVGLHEGGHTPFCFDVTEVLQAGENTVTVRVEDLPKDRYIPRGKQHWELKSTSIFYTRTSGIWQSVWLELVGDSYLEQVRVKASIDGAVTFDARIACPQDGLTLHASIRSEGRLLAASMGEVDGIQASVGIAIRQPRLWSDRHPYLYDVTYELRKGAEVLDRVESYFGFRSIVVQDRQILLNGNPIYLKGILDQGYWPESLLTPPSDAAIRHDIQIAKDMGFNMARKHQKVEDPRYLYWADKMGLLVSAEMANAYDFDNEPVLRLTREWIEVVERDYNHPSIIIWVPLNESWGVPNVADPSQSAHLRALYWLTKSLDSTRLVIDNDGWEHTEATDLFAIHDYTRSGDILAQRFKGVGQPGVPVPNFAKMNLVPGATYNGAPLYLSEFGGISYVPTFTNEVPENSWGYSGIEPVAEAALQRIEGLYRAIADIPAITAVCYTQLTDVEQEVNGLLTYDRKLKFDVARVRRINEVLTAAKST
ncbi:MAG: glycoside hydrolase family 2 protein [Bryobacteraceae bacterium]